MQTIYIARKAVVLIASLSALCTIPAIANAQTTQFTASHAPGFAWAHESSNFHLEFEQSRFDTLSSPEANPATPPADLVAKASVAKEDLGDHRIETGDVQGPPAYDAPPPQDGDTLITAQTPLKNRGWTPGLTKLEVAYQVANLVDLGITAHCLNQHTCTEKNPIFGSNPSTAALVATKAAGGAAHYILVHAIARKNTRLAKILSATSLVLQSGVVAFNITQLY